MRIAVAGLAHEALTFCPAPTVMADFDMWVGDEVLEFPGMDGLAEELDLEIVPVLIANSRSPGGCVEEATFAELRDRIVEGIVAAGAIDGVCLVLHGALLVEDGRSGEAELLRRIRRRSGDEVLIAARLDLHAILSDEFVEHIDIWTGYRTAPHRDIPETLRRAMRLLARAIRAGHKPRAAFVRPPLPLPAAQAATHLHH